MSIFPRLTSGLGLFFLSPLVLAADAIQGGDPLDGATGLIKVVFALALIVAMIFAMGWFLRRFGVPGKGKTGGLLNVVDSVHLGSRERVVLIGVGDRQVLVGVTPAGISRLGEFPGTTRNPEFSDTLQQLADTNPAEATGK